MNPFHPFLQPRKFVSTEREAGNQSLSKAFIALAFASVFISFLAVFAIYPLFDEVRFAGKAIPLNLYGALWNLFLIMSFCILFQIVEFIFVRFLFKGSGDFAFHSYFSSTLSLVFIPVAILISAAGLLAGFFLRLTANPTTAYEFVSGSWPLFASYSSAYSLFPVLGFNEKIPIWVFDASATYNSPIFFTLLFGPLLSILLIVIPHSSGIAEIHNISSAKALLSFLMASLVLLTVQFLLFTVSYSFIVMH